MDLLKSLVLGLYLEHPITWLHRLDARVKLAWLMSFLAMPILANALWRIVLVGVLIVLTLAATIPLRVWRQQMGWLLLFSGLMLGLTMIMPDGLGITSQPRLPTPEGMASLTSPAEILPALPQPTSYRYVVFQAGPVKVTQQSVELGLRLGTLFFTLIYGTNLFLLTTASEEITAALEVLMRPLRWFKWPVTEIALTMTLALRFMPLVLEEIQNLVRSVMTRAINWKKLGWRRSAQVGLMLVERLLENLLLRAEQTAAAMAVRGFTSPDEHRVDWYSFRLSRWDGVAIALLLCFWWLRLVWGGEG